MGTIIQAVCLSDCGFNQEVIFGGGMMNFTTHCYVPAINKKTGEFQIANYFDKENLVAELMFYDDPSMYKEKPGVKTHNWGDIKLKTNYNLCPNCKAYSLAFQHAGCFD